MSHIHLVRDFYSYPESLTRTLRVYTPDAYDHEPHRRFPVLYMLDGQNVFAHPESARPDTWEANTTMDRLAAEGRLDPWLIVAVDHTAGRFEEYSAWDVPERGASGRGWAFADFLVNHLKPFVDRTWRTRPESPHTAVMGASLGGLMALTLGKAFPHVVGRVGALSPSVMWADGAIYRLWSGPTGRWLKLYLDTGDRERYWFYDLWLDYVTHTASFYHHLKGLGLGPHELRFVVAEGHDHAEPAWAARLPGIFEWLLEEARGV
jgi:predicted alpha/beta superfamily hydrolase